MKPKCRCTHEESDHRNGLCKLYGYYDGVESDRCQCKEFSPIKKSKKERP